MKIPNQSKTFGALLHNCIFSKTIAIVVFIFSACISYSQENTYKIIDQGTAQDIAVYTSAMNAANFDRFRYKTTGRVLNFTEGVQIELLSVEEVLSKGLTVNHSGSTKPKNLQNYQGPTYRVSKTGHIISEYPITGK